jgi:hypothetical protein
MCGRMITRFSRQQLHDHGLSPNTIRSSVKLLSMTVASLYQLQHKSPIVFQLADVHQYRGWQHLRGNFRQQHFSYNSGLLSAKAFLVNRSHFLVYRSKTGSILIAAVNDTLMIFKDCRWRFVQIDLPTKLFAVDCSSTLTVFIRGSTYQPATFSVKLCFYVLLPPDYTDLGYKVQAQFIVAIYQYNYRKPETAKLQDDNDLNGRTIVRGFCSSTIISINTSINQRRPTDYSMHSWTRFTVHMAPLTLNTPTYATTRENSMSFIATKII